MTAITPVLATIQIEETKYGASISEYTSTKIGGAINYINENAIEPIGTVLDSFLTETQFQALKGNKWVLMEGQSIAGSDLAVLTGITTLPDAVTNRAFTSQSLNDGELSTYVSAQNLAHTHFIANSDSLGEFDFGTLGATNRLARTSTNGGYGLQGSATASNVGLTSSNGGSELRPNTIRVNKFVKINSENT